MKKSLALMLALVCICSLTACSKVTENKPPRGSMLLKEGTVEKVHVSSNPGNYVYEFEKESAQAIVDYLANLNLYRDFKENPEDYSGMTWVISLEYENGEKTTIYQFANLFIRTENDPWIEIRPVEAERFGALLEELRGREDESEMQDPYFTGIVREKYDGSCLMHVTGAGSGQLTVGQDVVVHMNIPDCPDFAVGEVLTIQFDGKMTCSLPPQVVGIAILVQHG